MQKTDLLMEQVVYALGVDNAAFHAEAMVHNEEIYLVEMGARPGGGHIFGQIVEAASGVVMPQALSQILLGEETDITAKHQRGACYRFFAPPTGIFVSATGTDENRFFDLCHVVTRIACV